MEQLDDRKVQCGHTDPAPAGQPGAEITAAAPRLTSVFGAAGLKVIDRSPEWVPIVLVDRQGECGSGHGVRDVRNGSPDDGPRLREFRVV